MTATHVDDAAESPAARQARLARKAAILLVPCPRCGAEPGWACRTPSGSYMPVPHQARRSAAADAGRYRP